LHLVYIDDSRDERICAFSALTISSDRWSDAFGQVRDFRKALKASDCIYIHKEFHACEFVSGRGRIAPDVVTKYRRCVIFKDALRLVAELPNARLFNAVFPKSHDERAFERLLNRINRTMVAWGSEALLICDEGKEAAYTKLARKLHVYNPIPASYGTWNDTGQRTRNIPIERIIEDPFFKRSDRSYFIQLVDFCAYSLLRKERPLASKSAHGLDVAFDVLSPILVLEASRSDPMGVIRP